ncbi:MAG: hypothetical protein JXA23_02770 [Bacteroidales bacterium]|nr:hypothetical protein [Bacteroidales bacterium]
MSRLHHKFVGDTSNQERSYKGDLEIVFGKTYIPVSEKYQERFREFLSKHFFE